MGWVRICSSCICSCTCYLNAMTRVTITYSCGCEITPYVDTDDELVHEYDVNIFLCDEHTKEAIRKARHGDTVPVPTPFDNLFRERS